MCCGHAPPRMRTVSTHLSQQHVTPEILDSNSDRSSSSNLFSFAHLFIFFSCISSAINFCSKRFSIWCNRCSSRVLMVVHASSIHNWNLSLSSVDVVVFLL